MKFKKHKQNKQTNKNNINRKKTVPPFLQHFHLPTEKSNGKHR